MEKHLIHASVTLLFLCQFNNYKMLTFSIDLNSL
ncbi:hypothetical protein SAMN06272774_1785 [Synechococcus sp. 7002]|nr:hypothetical protein SYNPCC7002_A2296 [Picosynechococcus sp. PCC 7002]SMQ82383.1 hypothetical protein SAMN06272774_1785 [Synechococcus sp. 7002]